MLLTQRGRFFNKEEYTALVYKGLIHTTRRIKLLPPAILKPEKLWSGKQVSYNLSFKKGPIFYSFLRQTSLNLKRFETIGSDLKKCKSVILR